MSTRAKRASTAAASASAEQKSQDKKVTGKRGKKQSAEENGEEPVTSPSKKGKTAAKATNADSPASRTRSRSPSPSARKEDKASEDLDPEVKHHESKIVYGKPNGKVAFITGITGQDGSYLAELLLEKGYHVHGMIRRSSSFNTGRVEHLYIDRHATNPRFFLHYGDLSDSTALVHIIGKIKPDEVYNLAAQSHVAVSFEMAEYTGNIDGLGTLRLLDAIRTCNLGDKVRFYQASTSELYGMVREPIQSETTPFYPRSPYAVAKQYAYWIVVNYREAYGMHASNGILFNHESPRRGPTFVTRKTTRAVARIAKGLQDCLYLGNLDSQRDWGHAKDYVYAMWLMMQSDKPDDYVVSTGETHRVRKFVDLAFAAAGITIKWSGSGVKEIGTNVANGKVVVRVDPQYFRPTEVDLLLGNPGKIKKKLGWELKVQFEDLVKEMVAADLAAVEDKHLKW